jgi:hypothetical protein
LVAKNKKREIGVSHVDVRNSGDWLISGAILLRKFPTIKMRMRGTSEAGIKLSFRWWRNADPGDSLLPDES